MNAKQQQIASALQSEDYEAASRLVNESIKHLLNTRLNKNQLSILEAMKAEHGDMLNRLLSQAFQKGWARGGELSNAMNDTLQAAQTMVQAYGLFNEGMAIQGPDLTNISTDLGYRNSWENDMVKSIFSKQESANAGSMARYGPGTFLSPEEITVYNALSEIFNGESQVFTKVALAEFATPLKRNSQYLAHWRRVQRRTIDFLIYSMSIRKPILAIKLETEADSIRRQLNGPDILEEVLSDINLPLLRLLDQDQYDTESLTIKTNFVLNEHRQMALANGHDPYEREETTTTTLNQMLTAAATRPISDLWASAKAKYRPRVLQ